MAAFAASKNALFNQTNLLVPAIVVTGGSLALDAVLLYFCGADASFLFPIILFSSSMLGVGDAFLILFWGRRCCELPPQQLYPFVLGAHALAFLLSFAVIPVSSLLVIPLLAVLLVISCYFASRGASASCIAQCDDGHGFSEGLKDLFIKCFKDFRYPLFYICFFILIGNMVHKLSYIREIPVSSFKVMLIVSVLVAVLILYVLTVSPIRRASMTEGIIFAFIITAAGLSLLPFFWRENDVLAILPISVGINICMIVLWCGSVDVARRHGTSAYLFVGVTQALGLFATAAGDVLGLVNIYNVDSPEITAIALVSMYVLSAGALYLIRQISQKHGPHSFESVEGSFVPSEKDAVDQFLEANFSSNLKLTQRERDILASLVQGRTIPYIAEELHLSKNTVKTHAGSLYRKLDVHSRQDLIDLYIQTGSERP